MRFLTWNVKHATNPKRRYFPRMAEALAGLSPDCIVLTEYVEGVSHDKFTNDLNIHGFPHILTSKKTPDQNQVLIASKTLIIRGDIPAPDFEPAFSTNVLHVKIPDPGVEILGIRMPSYLNDDPLREKKRNDVWNWITSKCRSKADIPFVALGDFNTAPYDKGDNGGERFKQFVNDGWTHALPNDGASWWWRNKDEYGRQLDHALLSRDFMRMKAEYRTEYSTENESLFFARKPGAMSDHAVLVVEADLIQ